MAGAWGLGQNSQGLSKSALGLKWGILDKNNSIRERVQPKVSLDMILFIPVLCLGL